MLKRFFVLICFVFLLFSCVSCKNNTKQTSAPVTVYPAYSLILDAGHGGEDGGAVSLSGVPESIINLSVAKRTDLLLGLFGIPCVMLRQEDVSLHDANANTLREKKVSDLKNRVAAIESEANPRLISIHQNTFSDRRYHGAQVFFAPTAGSQALAETMQEALRTTLDPDNQRVCKPIPDTIYLMNHISCPAILVECGFLSNPNEEQLLLSPAYQTKLALALTGGWLLHQTNTQERVLNENKEPVLLHQLRK